AGLAQRQPVALQLLDQVGDDLGVGLRQEVVALGLELGAQLGVVLDDAVVHHRQRVAGDVRMGIVGIGRAVGGPAGVGDAGAAGQRRAALQALELLHLAVGTQPLQAPFGDHGDAGGVVAAVLQCLEAADQVRDHVTLRADANDAAHGALPASSEGAQYRMRTVPRTSAARPRTARVALGLPFSINGLGAAAGLARSLH